jgi:hypothetical protein
MRWLASFCPFRLHLPTPLPSTRFCYPRFSRLPRRCGTMRALTPAGLSHARQVSPLTLHCLPSIPTPTTSCAPDVALSATSARPVGSLAAPGFATSEQARQRTPPNRVRHPTGCSFASGCSPPRLAATQLPSATCDVTSHDTDSHHADSAYSRPHSPAGLTRGSIRFARIAAVAL